MATELGGAVKELQVPQAMTALGYSIEKLETVAQRLGERINKVMRDEPGNKEIDKGVTAYCTPIAEDIRVYREKTDAVVNLLESYLYRLEI
jgi:hypothetical protein